MYNIKLHDYIPEPNPVAPDRIVAAHYYAAWKYGAAGLHEGFNDLAEEYPERTPLMGDLSPEKFRELLGELKKICDALPEDAFARKIIMIDNWNEWDEGHFVAPSHQFGFKYLQAIREVFTERENLPDYIMPHDAGFGGYNTKWRTPDFSAICEKRLKKGEGITAPPR